MLSSSHPRTQDELWRLHSILERVVAEARRDSTGPDENQEAGQLDSHDSSGVQEACAALERVQQVGRSAKGWAHALLPVQKLRWNPMLYCCLMGTGVSPAGFGTGIWLELVGTSQQLTQDPWLVGRQAPPCPGLARNCRVLVQCHAKLIRSNSLRAACLII